MEEKISKKGYYLPETLMVFFKKWCKPGRDYSPKIAGAIFYYMQLPPDVREECEKAAYSDDIEKAIKDLKPAMKPDRLYAMQDRFEKLLDDFSKIAKLSQARKRSTAGEKAESSITECIDIVRKFVSIWEIPQRESEKMLTNLRKTLEPVSEDPAVDAARIASDAERGAKQLNKKDRGVRESRAKAQ